MFCSHCGKTLNPESPTCPHCGQAVGDSRMTRHTSVQPRYLPKEQEKASVKYTPYTKTTYTSMDDVGEDVYSRTSYRPVLSGDNPTTTGSQLDEAEPADEAQEGEGQEAPAQEAEAEGDLGITLGEGEISQQQRQSLEKLQQVPEDAPAPDEAQQILAKELDIKVEPLKPIRKTGISPEVEGYIQRMESIKNRNRKKADDEYDEEGQATELPSASDEDGATPTDKLARKAEKERKKALRKSSGVVTWVKRIAIVAVLVVLVGGGIIFLGEATRERSPIEGVSLPLYNEGLALIQSHTTQAYRDGIVNLYRTDNTGASALAQQMEDMNAIQSLKAETPLENDDKFVQTLVSIQNMINSATVNGAIAALDTNPSSSEAMQKLVDAQWGEVENAVNRISEAADAKGLANIEAGLVAAQTTPEPEATPEPPMYLTLKRRSKGQEVKDLQARLLELGYFTGIADGIYGTHTQTAVKYFQQAVGLEITGIATDEVQRMLFADDAPVYTPGARKDTGITTADQPSEGASTTGTEPEPTTESGEIK